MTEGAFPLPYATVTVTDEQTGVEAVDPDAVQSNFEQLGLLLAGYQAPSAPIEVSSFSNAWVNFGATRVARYFKDRGRVYIEGLIKSGVVGSAAFTLPAGYRPEATISFAVDSNSALGLVYVNSDGTVVPASGNNAFFHLYGINFWVG